MAFDTVCTVTYWSLAAADRLPCSMTAARYVICFMFNDAPYRTENERISVPLYPAFPAARRL